MLNVVIPMAGRGSRFLGSPELVPKPLIEVERGRPMISYVVEHLRPARPHRFIFVARAEHAERFQLAGLLEQLAPGHELVLTDAVTGGPLETTLLAAPLLGPDDELLVSYCDSYFTIELDAVLHRWSEAQVESGVLIYPSDGPMEAYALLEPDGRIHRIAEKRVISGNAVAGLYYFRRTDRFLAAAARTMSAGTVAEVFVSSVCDTLAAEGALVLGHHIRREQRIEMGTPADLELARHWLARAAAPALT